MKRTPKILALTAGVIVLAGGLSVAAFAHPGGGGGHGFHRGGKMIGMPGMRMLALAESLDLTEEQEVAAIRLRRSIRDEAKQNREQMQAAFADVLAELEKPNPDPAKLHRLVDDASARMTKVAHSSVDKYLEFHRTLTPEQRQTLVENARQMKERREQFRKQRKEK